MKNFLIIFLILHSTLIVLHSQSIRPIRDDIGFCWNADEMNSFINWLDKNTGKEVYDSKNLIGGISVHDDYLYAGKVYFPFYKMIRAKEVIIFGVTHGTVKKEMGSIKNVLIFDEYGKWKGPYTDVEISPLREKIKSELPKDYFIVSNKAHSIEHSIEALIPFLQYYNRDIKITPVMVTQNSFERMDSISTYLSKIISEYASENKLKPGKDIFFLISNDANHYGEDFDNSPFGLDLNAHRSATENDKRIINENFSGRIDRDKILGITKELLPDSSNQKNIPLWCGRYPIILGLFTMQKTINQLSKEEIKGRLIKYSDTLTEKVLPIQNSSMGLTAIFSPKHWCGWFTLGIYSSAN